MNKMGNFFITVPALLLFHLPYVSFGQDQIKTTTLSISTETSDKSSFDRGEDDQETTHYFKSHTFNKLANLRFLAITNAFSQINDERHQPHFEKLLPEDYSAPSFLQNRSDLKNTKPNSLKKSYIGYSQVWTNKHYRNTSLVNHNITILRRFAVSKTSKYQSLNATAISTFTSLKISMKW